MTWRHEVRMLWRDRTARVVLLMCCAALLYALATGLQVAEQTRVKAANFEKAALARIEAQHTKVAQAEQGGIVTDRFAGSQSTLRAPAVLPVAPLALLTVGEMDLQSHTATVSLFTPADAAGKGQELQGPVSLAIGRFDLGFAVVVLMPLVLLALCHNQLAEDREQRRLPLLAAQADVGKLLWRRGSKASTPCYARIGALPNQLPGLAQTLKCVVESPAMRCASDEGQQVQASAVT